MYASPVDSFRSKRLLALLLGPGLWMLALDSWVSHFAGRSMAHFTQVIPVLFGAAAGTALVLSGLLIKRPGALALSYKANGALSLLVGLAGTFYHLKSLFTNMSEGGFTWPIFEEALSVAPPPLAPGAFAGLGALLFALGTERVLLTLLPRAGSAGGEEVLGDNVKPLHPVRKSASR